MNYEEIVCDANNLYRAYKTSVKSSKWKETTQKFMMNFLRYIFGHNVRCGISPAEEVCVDTYFRSL